MLPLEGITANEAGKFSDGSNVLLLVRGRSQDGLLECREEVGGNDDSLLLFANTRERPVGLVKVVRARDSVSSGHRNVKFEELVVVSLRCQRCTPRCSGGQICCVCCW